MSPARGARSRAAAVVVSVVTVLVASSTWSAVAQWQPGAPTPTTVPESTTTTAPPADNGTTTTTAPGFVPRDPDPGEEDRPPPPQEHQPPPPPAAANPDLPPLPPAGGDNTAEPPVAAGPFPADLQALSSSVQRSRANNTRALLDALEPAIAHGAPLDEVLRAGFGRFPIAGYASYTHDWWFPRFGPGWRLHQGTDIFADHGTPVRSPVDGTVRITNGGLGGLAVYVIQDDGTYFYLAHLAGLAEGLVEGQAVRTGDVVGFVGDSGNARGGAPHVHFEVHPYGGEPIDPKGILDQFIAEALAAAPSVVAAFTGAAEEAAPTEVAAPAEPVLPAGPPRAALLWASSVSPTGGALRLVEDEAARAVSSIDWEERAGRQVAADRAEAAGRRQARLWLAPLTPPLLAAALDPS